jgi:hypothetical protein
MTTIYQDVVEIFTSIGMNIIVAAGFIVDFPKEIRDEYKDITLDV